MAKLAKNAGVGRFLFSSSAQISLCDDLKKSALFLHQSTMDLQQKKLDVVSFFNILLFALKGVTDLVDTAVCSQEQFYKTFNH